MEESQAQGLLYLAIVDLERDLWNGDHTECVDVEAALSVVGKPFAVEVRSSYRLHLASAEIGGGQDAVEAAGEFQLGLHPYQAGT